MTVSTATPVVLEFSNDLVPHGGIGSAQGVAALEPLTPGFEFVHYWVCSALRAETAQAAAREMAAGAVLEEFGISVHLADAPTSQALNRDFRQIDKPTNVLSFPAGLPPLDGMLTLGELVLCPEVVQREASEQGKSVMDHWAHMLVHGSLHLVGYDHEQDEAAQVMEALEIRILSNEGISDPYQGAARESDE